MIVSNVLKPEEEESLKIEKEKKHCGLSNVYGPVDRVVCYCYHSTTYILYAYVFQGEKEKKKWWQYEAFIDVCKSQPGRRHYCNAVSYCTATLKNTPLENCAPTDLSMLLEVAIKNISSD